MATFYRTDIVTRRKPAKLESGPCTVATRAVFPVVTALAVNDIIEMIELPADHMIVDWSLDNDDLDSGTTALAVDVGLMSGAVGAVDLNRTVGTELFSNTTVLATATFTRASTRTGLMIAPAPYDRSIGIKVKTAATTAVVSSTSGTNNRGLWQANTAYAVGDYITIGNGLRAYCSTAGTSGLLYPYLLDTKGVAGTQTDGGVTWTIMDPYVALTVHYRSASW